MADNKKYYYLKLKDNFFESDEMIVLESMQDGYLYSNILLKLYLRSLKNEGRLMFNDKIPFNSQMLATITRFQVGVIEKAVKVFQDLGLIEVLDNGAIYMLDIQNFIGKGSTEADRIRKYRNQINFEKKQLISDGGQNAVQMYNKCTPEREIEIEKEIEIKKEIEREKNVDEKFARYFSIFYQFARKNGNKRAMTLQEFMALPPFQKDEAIIGAENYVKFYALDNPDDEAHQYSVNAYEFIKNALFGDYQEMPEVKKVAKKKKWI